MVVVASGTESRGNGARPVDLMIMNSTYATHRSRVPRRSSGKMTTVEDERGPGLGFILYFVCGSRPWGAAAFLLCLFILLLKCINVHRFPPPSHSTNCYSHFDQGLSLEMWTLHSRSSSFRRARKSCFSLLSSHTSVRLFTQVKVINRRSYRDGWG